MVTNDMCMYIIGDAKLSLFMSVFAKKPASTLCDPRATVARFTPNSCLRLNERGGAIPGVTCMPQLRVELLLTGGPTPVKTD